MIVLLRSHSGPFGPGFVIEFGRDKRWGVEKWSLMELEVEPRSRIKTREYPYQKSVSQEVAEPRSASHPICSPVTSNIHKIQWQDEFFRKVTESHVLAELVLKFVWLHKYSETRNQLIRAIYNGLPWQLLRLSDEAFPFRSLRCHQLSMSFAMHKVNTMSTYIYPAIPASHLTPALLTQLIELSPSAGCIVDRSRQSSM